MRRVHTTSSRSPASATLRCTALELLHNRYTHRPHARPSTWQRLLYGLAAPRASEVLDTVNRRRIQFVNQRLGDIGRRQPPDTTNYMDSGGTRRQVHTQEGQVARAALEVTTREVAVAAGSAPALLLTVPNALRPRGASAAMRQPARDGCADEAAALGDVATDVLGDEAAAPIDSSLSFAELAWYRLCRNVDFR